MNDQNGQNKVKPIGGEPKLKAERLKTFIEDFGHGFPIRVERIHSDGGPPVVKEYNSFKTLEKELVEVNAAGPNDRTRQWNLYMPAARVRSGTAKKARKEDIEEVTHLWVDLDPEKADDWGEARERLLRSLTRERPEGVPVPTNVVDSGNGFWGFWRLREPIVIPPYGEEGHEAAIDLVEEMNRWLATRDWAGSAGDSCHNIDRIFRLPESANWPTPNKRKNGYTVRQASYLEHYSSVDADYTPEDFGREKVERKRHHKPKAGYADTDTEKVDLAEITEKCGDKIAGYIVGGPNENCPDRSNIVWAIACAMARAEFSDAAIRYVLLEEGWWPSGHVYDQPVALRYVNRNVERARATAYADSQRWVKDKYGEKVATSTHNAIKAILKLGLTPRYDEFTRRVIVGGLEELCGEAEFSDRMCAVLLGLIGHKFRLELSETKLRNTMGYLAHKKRFDSLQEAFDTLPEWDGVARADRIFIDYAGAEDTRLNEAIGRNFMMGAASRVYDPGGEIQFMVIFESPQDIGKSTFLRTLAMYDEYFTDGLDFKADPKTVMDLTRGKWIIEIPELSGKSAAEDERKKAFITRQVETARLSYGRESVDIRRRFMITGSTNDGHYLTDQSGNRRYWMIRVGDKGMLDCDRLEVDVVQMWAEIKHRYLGGERHDRRLNDELKGELAARQKERLFPNQDVQLLYDWFGNIDDEWAVHGRLTAGELNEIVTGSPNPRASNYRIRDYKKGFIEELGFTETKVPIETGNLDDDGRPIFKLVKGYYRHPDISERKQMPRIKINKQPNGEIISITSIHIGKNGTEDEVAKSEKPL